MHGAAHWNALSCWIAGGTVIIQDHPEHVDPADVLDTVERNRATSLLVVGDPMARPLVDALRHGCRRTCRRCATCCRAAPCCRRSLKAELLELVPGLTIVDVLGSTESGRQGVSDIASGDDAATPSRPRPPRWS